MTKTDYNDIRATNVAMVEKETKETVTTETVERVPKKAVTTASAAEEKKPGLMTRLVRGILGPNGIRAIGSYLGREVIRPALKDTLVNAINTGVNMAAYGEDRSRYNGYSGGWSNPSRYYNNNVRQQYTNYSSAYHPQQQVSNSVQSINSPGRIKIWEIDRYQDAKEVLGLLQGDIMRSGRALLADYYDYINRPSADYTDNAYGWRNLDNVSIIPSGGKYILGLPPVEVV
jgi:hypothetical protein